MSEKTKHQLSHRQLSMFEEDMNFVPYTSPKKGIGTFERLNDYEGFTEKFKPKKTTDDCYTPTIVLGAAGSERIDVVITEPEFSVEECEEIADKLTEFFEPYFEKYKIRKIY